MPIRIRHCLLFLLVIPLAVVSAVASDDSHTIAMDIRRNMPFVQVMVNGKGPFTFGIDTGTGGQALVSPALMEELHLPVIGEAEVGDPSGLNPRKVPTVRIHSLKFAGVEFKNVNAAQHEPSQREGECDGILGFVLFRDYLLTLDYPQQRLTLTPGRLADDGGNAVLPFTMPDNVPVIQLRVGSRTIDAHVDSRGAGLSLPEKLVQDVKFVTTPVVLGRGRTVSNEFEIKGAQLASDIQLGGYTFTQPFVEINPVLPLANFGAIPLQHFAVTFDQKNRRLRLAAPEKNIVISPPQIRRATPGKVQQPPR